MTMIIGELMMMMDIWSLNFIGRIVEIENFEKKYRSECLFDRKRNIQIKCLQKCPLLTPIHGCLLIPLLDSLQITAIVIYVSAYLYEV